MAVSVILSLLFLLTIYLSIVVIFTGDWFFQVLEERLPPPLAELIPLRLLSQLWGWLRYLLLFFCVLLLVLAVYRMGTPPPLRREKRVLRLTALLSPPGPWWPARCCSPGSSACPPGTPWCTAPWPP